MLWEHFKNINTSKIKDPLRICKIPADCKNSRDRRTKG
jgi:hypothetical protein